MKKITIFFITLIVLAISTNASAQAVGDKFQVDKLYYEITNLSAPEVKVAPPETYSWGDITKPTGNLTIPASITYNDKEYAVTAIGDYALRSCDGLTSITVPNSVTTIGNRVFQKCNGLTSIAIPGSVTTIGNEIFFDCSALATITVDTSNKDYSSQNGILFNYDKTTITAYPAGKTGTSYTIPSSVTSIAQGAFAFCANLTSVTIPNSVTTMGIRAFYWCGKLTSITIPNSVTSIGDYALSGCSSLTAIHVNTDNTAFSSEDGVLFNYDKTKIIAYPPYKIEDGMIVPSYDIPYSVTSIGNGAFISCEYLTSIAIPSSIATIGDNAFWACTELSSITIPHSVTTIGSWAFGYCTGLRSINCYVADPASITTFGKDIFLEIPKNYCTLSVPIGSKDKYAAAEQWKDFMPNIQEFAASKVGDEFELNGLTYKITNTLSPEVTLIGPTSSKLKGDLIIPNSVTYYYDDKEYTVTAIEHHAFYCYEGFTSIAIPSSVKKIGDFAFSGILHTAFNVDKDNTAYSSQDGILFNYNKTTIVAYPAGKEGKSYSVPASVTSIENGAFAYCYRLTSITIPKSVTTIGEAVFYYCKSLTAINVDTDNKQYSDQDGVLFNYDKTRIVNYPAGKADESYTIPSFVTSIGHGAFASCSGLTSITIPKSITSIESWAFEECNKLSVVNCHIADPASITTFGEGVFVDVSVWNCTLYVPIGSKEKYLIADQWEDFGNIVEKDFGTELKSLAKQGIRVWSGKGMLYINADFNLSQSAVINVYSMSGALVRSVETKHASSLQIPVNAGTYIVRIGDATEKTIVQ
ncbi:MAG TPA: leucine-rich repeat domain-containing protein [Bacteroidales bacterium]|nr:leucine-rich repeat domain-containing protein [Bacteroidales bacterium]